MVDVIILNWNGRKHLERCMPAMESQTYNQFNIIVVNNGSSDDSYTWLRAHYPSVKVVDLKENVGFTGGNIAGYNVSTADYVVLLNNDTQPEPDWLEALVRAADEHPDAGIVASVMLQWGTENVDTAGDSCTWAGNGYKEAEGKKIDDIKSGYVFGACAGAALYKRKMLDQIGFLDPDFFLNQEDTDLNFRAQLFGWKVWLEQRARVHHRVHATTGKLSPNIVFYASRNIEFVFWKNMPLGLLLFALPHKILQFFISLYFTGIKHGNFLPFLKGKFSAIKSFAEIRAKRRLIQSKRCASNQYIASILTPVVSYNYLIKRLRSVSKPSVVS